MPARPKTTPSTTVDTEGSAPCEVVMVPTPRMKSAVSLLDALARKFTVGIWVEIASMEFRLPACSCSPLSTETAMGTDCSDCSRLVAVTTTSSRRSTPASCCAWAMIGSMAPQAMATAPAMVLLRLDMSGSPFVVHIQRPLMEPVRDDRCGR